MEFTQMFRKSLLSLALLGAGLLGVSAVPASALSGPFVQQSFYSGANGDNHIELAASKRERVIRDLRNRDIRRYERRRDGPRCLTRYGNCRYYYGGYYYHSPWWTFPLIGGTLFLGNRYYGGGYGSRHVQWCLDRYRSYNVRTNTWVGYSGRVYQCRSPYWP
jgi:BA14K-like protein